MMSVRLRYLFKTVGFFDAVRIGMKIDEVVDKEEVGSSEGKTGVPRAVVFVIIPTQPELTNVLDI